MNRSSLQSSGRKRQRTEPPGNGAGSVVVTARPLVPLDELTASLTSGQTELFLVRLPRGFNSDRLHDEDLASEALSVDGIPLEAVTDKGTGSRSIIFRLWNKYRYGT